MKIEFFDLRAFWDHLYDINGLVQGCSNYIANTLELPQSYIKPSIYSTKS